MKTKMFKRLMLTRTETLSSKMEGQSKMIHKYLQDLQQSLGTINTQNVAIHDIVKHLVLTDELNTIFRNAMTFEDAVNTALEFFRAPSDENLQASDEQIHHLGVLSRLLHDIASKNGLDRRPERKTGQSGRKTNDIRKKSSRKNKKPQVDHQKQKSPRI